MIERTLEVLFFVALGLGVGYLFLAPPPEPPPGICDGGGTSEECIDWWEDMMDRP